jgi:osmotically-inducible protein OsmY
VKNPLEAAAEPACTDAELTDAVGRALAWDLWVPDERLTVTVSGGRVTLEGEVNSRFQRDAAVRDVSRLHGVRGVTDRLAILPTPTAAEVGARIARTLGTDAVPGTIRVETFPGAVLLRGSVPSRGERDGAERAAWSVPGVREVCNGLEVAAPPDTAF